jgi:hypothetical protein
MAAARDRAPGGVTWPRVEAFEAFLLAGSVKPHLLEAPIKFFNQGDRNVLFGV